MSYPAAAHIDYPKEIRFTTTNTMLPSYQIHSHPFYEIYYFVQGDADYMVEGKEYHLTPHSLILLAPNSFHGVRVNSTADYVRCSVHFPASNISPERRQLLLGAFPKMQKTHTPEVFFEHTDVFGIEGLLKGLIAAQSTVLEYPADYFTIFLEALLAQISLMYHTLAPSTPQLIVPAAITEIITYINEHLTEHMTLDELSEKFLISKYYMNRAFKKATGTTVIDYLLYKRIIFARQQLLNGASAEQAALSAGFGDYSSFYRSYKKFMGTSPTKELAKTAAPY